MKLEGKLFDFERVNAIIIGLPDLEKDKAIKAGLRAASYVFLSGGKRRLRQRMKKPEGHTGNLLGSFQIRVKRVKLGALAGFGRVRDLGLDKGEAKGYHAHLVDLGTASRRTIKLSLNRGVMPGNLFWTDTINQDQDKASQKLYKAIERSVEKLKNRRP